MNLDWWAGARPFKALEAFGEDFGFCFKYDGKVLEKFEEGKDMILFTF